MAVVIVRANAWRHKVHISGLELSSQPFSSCPWLPEVGRRISINSCHLRNLLSSALAASSQPRSSELIRFINVTSGEMFTTSRSKSYRDSFGYRAGKATSKKKGGSFKEIDPSQSRRRPTQQPTQGSPTKSQGTSSSPTSP